MKTNREIFIDSLSKMSDSEFAKYTTGAAKCLRCANYYWDGNLPGCHENINNSSCGQGMIEWLSSYPDECLSVKYHKKYSAFKSHAQACLFKKLIMLLYTAGLINKTEPCCGRCTDCSIEKVCYAQYANIRTMAEEYSKENRKNLDSKFERVGIHGIGKNHKNILMYISEILVPKIPEPERREQAESLIEMIIKDN